MRDLLLGVASAAAVSVLVIGAARADPPAAAPAGDNAITPQGVAGIDYSYVGLNQGLGNANVYGGELGGIVPFSQDFSGQVTGGYHRIASDDIGANDWNVAGTVSWDPHWGRLGVNVGYTDAGLLGASASVTNYGVYGEMYGDQYTLGARGGGATLSANALGVSGSETGGYGGGEAIGYLAPDFAVRGTVGYVGFSGGNQWTAGVHGEYLFSETVPISGWVGYDYASLGGGGIGETVQGNVFSIGLKYYLGGTGSLLHRQRTGEDDWGPAALDLTH
ncbi:MAG TPA: hypothetical protein VME40_16280 [Caulobacteraceae bacterium]|nr:hypothetical protein [Caulobacteraceae bacterium]